MKKSLWLVAFTAIWSGVTILALTLAGRADFPDNVHVNYGLPLVWATRTLSTIAGPVDVWRVDILSLTSDLAVWLGILVIGAAILSRRGR